MTKKIEMVCTANHGRSPVAELIGRNYLREIGALGDYEASSSGTSVDDIEAGRFSDAVIVGTLELGKQRALYSPAELGQIEQAVKDGDNAPVYHLFMRAVETFQREEHAHRAEALVHFGLEGAIKDAGEQTIARPDTVAVLSMAASNNKKVQAVYDGSGYSPSIDVLSRFATGDADAALPDAFGKEKPVYFAAVEMLVEHVPMAIDRLVN